MRARAQGNDWIASAVICAGTNAVIFMNAKTKRNQITQFLRDFFLDPTYKIQGYENNA